MYEANASLPHNINFIKTSDTKQIAPQVIKIFILLDINILSSEIKIQ